MLSRPLCRHLARPLARPLTRQSGPALDPDAAAYIAALVTAGATISSVQSSAIDTFIRAEKAGSRWDLIKRLYLPIWGIAAPNAICIRSLTSGTFVGGVTHGAGFVQGDGSTGYFDTSIAPHALGILTSSQSIFAICNLAPTGISTAGLIGAIDGSDVTLSFFMEHRTGTTMRCGLNDIGDGVISTTLVRESQNGVLIASREGGDRRFHRRSASAYETLNDDAGADSGTVPTTKTIQCMRSSFGSGGAYSNGRYGVFGVGLGITSAAADPMSANIKTLWETCTGLSLPA